MTHTCIISARRGHMQHDAEQADRPEPCIHRRGAERDTRLQRGQRGKRCFSRKAEAGSTRSLFANSSARRATHGPCGSPPLIRVAVAARRTLSRPRAHQGAAFGPSPFGYREIQVCARSVARPKSSPSSSAVTTCNHGRPGLSACATTCADGLSSTARFECEMNSLSAKLRASPTRPEPESRHSQAPTAPEPPGREDVRGAARRKRLS